MLSRVTHSDVRTSTLYWKQHLNNFAWMHNSPADWWWWWLIDIERQITGYPINTTFSSASVRAQAEEMSNNLGNFALLDSLFFNDNNYQWITSVGCGCWPPPTSSAPPDTTGTLTHSPFLSGLCLYRRLLLNRPCVFAFFHIISPLLWFLFLPYVLSGPKSVSFLLNYYLL